MFLQFELWKDCKNNCPFCCNRDIPRVRNKLESLKFAYKEIDRVLDKIYRERLEPCDSISLIGGEFFGGYMDEPGVRQSFDYLVDLIVTRIGDGNVKRGLICTSLMFDDLDTDYFDFLKNLHYSNYAHRFLVCTSWDPMYRFNSVTAENWERNVKMLHVFSPDTPLHVEIIMTQAFIDAYIHGGFSVRAFEDRWGCKVDFNTPYVPFCKFKDKKDMDAVLPRFFPKRADFFRLLEKAQVTGDIDLQTLLSVGQHSSNLYYTLDDKTLLHLDDRHRKNNTCLRERTCEGCQCCGYIDSDRKMRGDVEAFLAARL